MVETYEEVKKLSHGTIVIWLDAHIGNPDYHHHLKAAFASSIDPTNLKPIELPNRHGIDTSYPLFPRRVGIPCELRTFVDPESCLRCIHESLDANKRIYLITSDSLGRTLLPHIVQQYPKVFQSLRARISFYIFTYYMLDSLDWLYDYMDYTLIFDHEADLLWRLVHDIAAYYTEIGKMLLGRDMLIDIHQALIYFEWANALTRHEKNITIYQDIKFVQDLQYLIQQAEEKIQHHMSSVHNEQYSQGDMQRSLTRSIFIYYSDEFHDEAAQLLSMLQNLTREQGTLSNNNDAYIVQLKSESRAVKYYCPIVISSNKSDQRKILEELSSLVSVNHIYVWNPVEDTSAIQDEQTILESFPKIRNIYLKAKILAREWTAERASTCEKIGALCTKNGDSDLARMYYAKAIELNENLATFIKKK
jgi:tetratricopeptide (TPR) repeat protein